MVAAAPLGLALCALAASTVAQDIGQFPVTAVPGTAWSMEAGDLDADGRLDLCVADGSIRYGFLGRLDGTLSPALESPGVSFGSFGNKVPLSLADADGDGFLDAFGDMTSLEHPEDWTYRTGSRRGTGHGTFTEQLATPHGFGRDCDVHDLDGDGWPDMVVTDDDSISVYHGGAGGTLDVVQRLATARATTLGDVDGDGWLDLVCTRTDVPLVVHRGRGDGTFGSEQLAAGVDDIVSAIVLRDLDRDGDDDALIVTGVFDPATFTVDHTLHVLHAGVGPFPLTFVQSVPLEVTFGALTVADLDTDGYDDVVVAAPPAAGPGIVWFSGVEGGTLGAAHLVSTDRASEELDAVDLDEDGYPDLLTVGSDPGGPLLGTPIRPAIIRGGPNGPPGFPSSSLGIAFEATALDDVDGDGTADLIGVRSDPADGLLVADGLADGGFLPAASVLPGEAVTRVATGDANQDGQVDLLAHHGSPFILLGLDPGRVSFIRSAGANGFAAPLELTNEAPTALALSDVDGDGLPDAIWGRANPPGWSWRRGLGDGTFAPALSFATSSAPSDFVHGDVDGDGFDDLVVVLAAEHAVTWWRGAPGGPSEAATVHLDGPPTTSALTDLDRAGSLDLVVGLEAPTSLQVVLNLAGPHGFPPPVEFGKAPLGLACADFGRDGRTDLLVTLDGNARVLLLRGNGAGEFSSRTRFDAGTSPRMPFAHDVDEDGWADAVVAAAADQVVTLFNRGGPIADLHFKHAPPGTALPTLDATGELTPDSKLTFTVGHVEQPAVGALVVGDQTAFTRLTAGAVLAPQPQGVILWPGQTSWTTRWPDGAPETGLYVQAAFASGAGLTLSNALLLAP